MQSVENGIAGLSNVLDYSPSDQGFAGESALPANANGAELGIINLTRDEREAIRAIDEAELTKLIEQTIREQHVGSMYGVPFSRCGAYLSRHFHEFQMSMIAYAKAKSGRKIEETRRSVDDDARRLVHAVSAMKAELAKQEKQGNFFYVEDQIMWPHRFTNELRVRVGFRWRSAVEDDWSHGSIIFTHIVVEHPRYASAEPKRKPSAAKQEEQRQQLLTH